MEKYKTIDFRFGALIECEHVAVDNVYSIDIYYDDEHMYFNMDLNDINGFVVGTIVQCDDIIDEVNAVTYDANGLFRETLTPIIENGKMIYNKEE